MEFADQEAQLRADSKSQMSEDVLKNTMNAQMVVDKLQMDVQHQQHRVDLANTAHKRAVSEIDSLTEERRAIMSDMFDKVRREYEDGNRLEVKELTERRERELVESRTVAEAFHLQVRTISSSSSASSLFALN